MSDKFDRATAVIWSNRGKDERDRGFFVRALACFDKALEFDPNYPLALSNKAQTLLDLWRVEEAGEYASRALSLDPRSRSAYINRGLSSLYQGLFVEALRDFEIAIGMNDGDADALYNAGLALIYQGRLREAVRRLEDTLRLNAQYFSALYWLGLVCVLRGSPARGVELFDRALQLQPANESVQGLRGVAVKMQATGVAVDDIEIQMGPISIKLRTERS
jgi:tetratricopeptide (TPR) repeat protein